MKSTKIGSFWQTISHHSNLAIGLTLLPGKIRSDMLLFYRFCQLLDDVVDTKKLQIVKKKLYLQNWRKVFSKVLNKNFNFREKTDKILAAKILHIKKKYQIPQKYFLEFINGVENDLKKYEYQNNSELKTYCYGVACAVGIISAYIFGCADQNGIKYATKLGYALQLTNIIRDVREDFENKSNNLPYRIYLPKDLLKKYSLSAKNLALKPEKLSLCLAEFSNLAFYNFNQSLKYLNTKNKKKFIAAEAMRQIYFNLLKKMKKNKFLVFEKKFKLNKVFILCLLIKTKLFS